MLIDHIIGKSITQILEKWLWEDDNTYLIKLQTPVHGEFAYSE